MKYKKKNRNSKNNMKPQEKLSNKEEKELHLMKKWEETRKMGKRKYIILKGTISWSLLTSAIFILLSLITNKFLINAEILMYILKMFIVFIGIGTLFGIFSWELSEKKYLSFTNKKLNDK